MTHRTKNSGVFFSVWLVLGWIFFLTTATSAFAHELLWGTQAGGGSADKGRGVAGDGAGGSVVTGYFKDTATFGAGEPNETTLTSVDGSTDIFVARWVLP